MASTMRETDTHFHVGSFRIAKKGLNKKTLDALKQRFAAGGEVQKYADGTPEVPVAPAKSEFTLPPVAEDPGVKMPEAPATATDTTPAGPPALVPSTPGADAVLAGGTSADVGTTAPPAWLGPVAVDLSGQPSPWQMSASPPDNQVAPFLGETWAKQFEATNGRPPSQADFATARQVPPPPGTEAPALAPSHAVGEPPPGAGPVVEAKPQPGIQVPKAPSFDMYNVTGARQLYEKSVLDEAEARGAQVPKIQKAMADMAALNIKQRDLNDKAAAEVKRITDEGDAQSQQLFNDISTSRIDPNRLWANASTGQKVAGAIGMILGGIGSGLTGQPNLAVQLIDRAIDRDIDAQKATLDLKKTAFSWNLQRTQNKVQAALLTKMQGLDAVSASLDATRNKLGGELAQSNYDIAKAELNQRRAQARDQFVMNAMNQTKLKFDMEFLQAKRAALMQLADPNGMMDTATYAAVQALTDPKERQGSGWKPVVIKTQDADGKPILIPTRQHFLAPTDAMAAKATEDYKQIGIAEEAVARFKALEQKYAHVGSIDPSSMNEGEAAKNLVAQAVIAGGLGNEKPYGEWVRANEGFLSNPVRPDKAWFRNMQGVIQQLEMANAVHRRQVDGTVVPGFVLKPPSTRVR